jgi:phage protein D
VFSDRRAGALDSIRGESPVALKVKSGNTPKAKVTVGGKEVPKSAIRRVSVDRAVNMADTCMIDLRNDRCVMSDDSSLEPGQPAMVELGYQEGGGKFTRVFVGRVVALKGVFPRRGPMGVRVQGYSNNQLLTQGRRTRRFKDKSISKVVEEVVGGYGDKITPSVEDTGASHEFIFQKNQTDMEFVMQLAERVGYECSVQYHDSDPSAPAQFTFAKPKLESSSVRTLKKGENMLSFEPTTSTALAPTGVTVMSWDPGERKVIIGEAEGGDSPEDEATGRLGPNIVRVHEYPVRSEDEADKLAVSVMQRHAVRFIHAQAVLSGNPDLMPGVVVQVAGVGELFSRTYYVTRVIHDLHDGGFNTRLMLRSVTVAQETPESEPTQNPNQGGGSGGSGGSGGEGGGGGGGETETGGDIAPPEQAEGHPGQVPEGLGQVGKIGKSHGAGASGGGHGDGAGTGKSGGGASSGHGQGPGQTGPGKGPGQSALKGGSQSGPRRGTGKSGS